MNDLTDTKIRNSKPAEKIYKISDGAGLFLEIRPNGIKTWRYRYWLDPKKDGLYTIGDYPAVSLSEARKAREWARGQVKLGLNPTAVREADKQKRIDDHAKTFKAVAAEWLEEKRGEVGAGYFELLENTLEADVYPKIGALPIRGIEAGSLLSVVKAKAKSAPSVALLIRQWFGQIYRWAILHGYASGDPSVALKGAVKRRSVRHNPPLSADDIPAFVSKIDSTGYRKTQIAMKLLMLTFTRTQELRMATWSEIDLEAGEWRIPAEHMKMAKFMRPGEVHIVPLSRQSVELLRELQDITGEREHLFPNTRRPRECMARTTINRMIERLGFGGEFSGHGFRTTASTMLHERGYNSDVIEKQLSHEERDKTRAAYNHAEYLPERRKMMQDWADYIDGLVQKAVSPGDRSQT